MINQSPPPHSDADLMKTVATTRRPWARWGLIMAAWTLVGLFLGIRHYFDSLDRQSAAWWRSPFLWLSCSYIWAVLTPPTLYLAQRFPLKGRTWLRNVLIHVPASFLFSFLYLGISALAAWFVIGMAVNQAFAFDRLRMIFAAELSANMLAYWSIIAIGHALDYYRQSQERELRASQLELKASQLEVSLMQAQLEALKMQIHPHFLFNTLNTISVLMREDVKAANRMLLCLSDLLRTALDNAKLQEISLKQELALLKSYLEIEQVRFHDRLTVRMNIDSALLDARVPMFLLQPLVENAIRHGIAARPAAGTIEIRAERKNGTVELCICDDGPGLPDGLWATQANGIGLSNTRARLDQLYPETHRFQLSNAPEGGLVVTVAIPFRTNADATTKTSSER